MSKGIIVLIVLVVIIGFVFMQYVGVRNTLVTKDQAVKAAWSQVSGRYPAPAAKASGL